jgi:serine/threonine-protein kinase RsbW
MNNKQDKQMIEMRITSRLDQVSLLSVCTRAVALLHGFSEKQTSEIELAVNEAVTNIIKHAYLEDDTRPILMRLILSTREVSIEVMDQGDPPPDTMLHEAKPDFSDQPDDISLVDEGGRGLTLMKHMMDGLEMDTLDDWNIIRMTKRL